jgi:hypothetical protein
MNNDEDYTTDGTSVRAAVKFLSELAQKGNRDAQTLRDDIFSQYGLTPSGQSAADTLKKYLEKVNELRRAQQQPAEPSASQASSSMPPRHAQPQQGPAGPSASRPSSTPPRYAQPQPAKSSPTPEAVARKISEELARLSPTPPTQLMIDGHAALRGQAHEHLDGRLLVQTLGELGAKLPPGIKPQAQAHADLRRIAHDKLQGDDLIEAICTLDRICPANGERVDPTEHAQLRTQVAGISGQGGIYRALHRLSEMLPLREAGAAHADLRRIAGERLVDGAHLADTLGKLGVKLPPGFETAAYAELRRIAHGKLQGYDLILAISTLDRNRPPNGERIDRREHEELRTQAAGLSSQGEISRALSLLSEMLPLSVETAAHDDLRRIAHAKLQGNDLIEAISTLDRNRPPNGERIDKTEHAELRTQVEGGISGQAGISRALGRLSEMLPLRGAAAAHTDLGRIAGERLDGVHLAQTLFRLSEMLPPGFETAAHAELRRIAHDKLQGNDLSLAISVLNRNRPASPTPTHGWSR